MLRKTSILATLALVTSASLAAAEEHVILYLGDAFFPEVSYVKPGDTIRFLNSSSSSMTIVSASEQWEVGPVLMEGSDTLHVTGETELQFFDGPPGSEVDPVNGSMSFAPAPLG